MLGKKDVVQSPVLTDYMCLRNIKTDVVELAQVLASREQFLTIDAKPGLEVLLPRRCQIGPASFLHKRRNDKLRSYHAADAHRGRKVVASVDAPSAAARMVKERQVVILDSGTTTTAIARALRGFKNLTIITNPLNIAAELSPQTLDVILTGGKLRKISFSLVGPIAEETFRHLDADILSRRTRLQCSLRIEHSHLLESKVNRAMSKLPGEELVHLLRLWDSSLSRVLMRSSNSRKNFWTSANVVVGSLL